MKSRGAFKAPFINLKFQIKMKTSKYILGAVLALALVTAPALSSANNGDGNPPIHPNINAGCFRAFGHLIAPGWIKHNGTTTVSSHCVLPFGIGMKLGLFGHHGTTTSTTTPDTTAPGIFLINTHTGTSTATIVWFTNERADSQVAYGTTTSYGSVTPLNSTLSFFHSVTISGLSPNTTYHFEVMSRDGGDNLATSSDRTFTTKNTDVTPPVISDVDVSAVGSTTATVSWTTNEPATSKLYFQSGTSLDLGTANLIQSNVLTTNHSFVISGLTASTTYSYAVRSTDGSGNTSTSATGSFNTTI
jgi:hypothetical protein